MSFKGRKHTPETRAKIGLALVGRTTAPKGPEARAKMSQLVKARWQDPAFRAANLPRLDEMRAIWVSKCAERRQNRPPPKPVGRPRVRPPEGTPEYLWYRKVAGTLGIEAARSLQW
jgi:hypothetical protein